MFTFDISMDLLSYVNVRDYGRQIEEESNIMYYTVIETKVIKSITYQLAE